MSWSAQPSQGFTENDVRGQRTRVRLFERKATETQMTTCYNQEENKTLQLEAEEHKAQIYTSSPQSGNKKYEKWWINNMKALIHAADSGRGGGAQYHRSFAATPQPPWASPWQHWTIFKPLLPAGQPTMALFTGPSWSPESVDIGGRGHRHHGGAASTSAASEWRYHMFFSFPLWDADPPFEMMSLQ